MFGFFVLADPLVLVLVLVVLGSGSSLPVMLKNTNCCLIIFLDLSEAHFHFSLTLVNCSAVRVSKPSNPLLVGHSASAESKMPFFGDLWREWMLLYPTRSLLLCLLFPVNEWSYRLILLHIFLCLYPCCSTSPVSVAALLRLFVLTGLFRACCLCPLLLWPALWSYCGLALVAGDWTVSVDVQGKASVHQKHAGLWGCGTLLEPSTVRDRRFASALADGFQEQWLLTMPENYWHPFSCFFLNTFLVEIAGYYVYVDYRLSDILSPYLLLLLHLFIFLCPVQECTA